MHIVDIELLLNNKDDDRNRTHTKKNHSNSIQLPILGIYHELPQVLWGPCPCPPGFFTIQSLQQKKGSLPLGYLRGTS